MKLYCELDKIQLSYTDIFTDSQFVFIESSSAFNFGVFNFFETNFLHYY